MKFASALVFGFISAASATKLSQPLDVVDPVVCGSSLDCNCSLPYAPLDAACVTTTESSSTASNSVYTTSIPDKITVTDSVSCKDTCKAGTSAHQEVEVGTRTFTIEGAISINERFEASAGGNSEARAKETGCGHSESRKDTVVGAATCPSVCVCPQ